MRGFLGRYESEQVALWLTEQAEADPWLGQTPALRRSLSMQVSAHIQPLGAEMAAQYGLNGERERLRLYITPPLAGHVAVVGLQLEARGKTWLVERVEAWQSYTLLICEKTENERD